MGRRSWPALGAALVLVAGLAGCGVSRSDTASDEGDAAVVGAVAADSEFRKAPAPDSASSPEGLVRDFFKAAVGGGKAGTDQVKAFLNPHALESWQEAASPENPPMTVIRFLHPPTTNAVTGGRTPVVVDYLVIGNLTDQGQVGELADPPVAKSMTIYVVPDERNPSNLRIDEITNYLQPGLMLSDDALDDVYRVQPIYFWDSSYKLVPDVRYVPLTDPADVRAQRMVNWLVKGPGVPGLETMHGVSAPQVVSDSGTLTVKFTGDGPAPDNDGLRRMLFQLQWTLRPPGSGSPNVRLVIDDKPQEVAAGADEYQSANRSWNFRQTSPPRYDVAENKVVSNPGGANPLPVLAGAENQSVFAAAVGRGGAVAAFVRSETSGRRYLQIVREGGVLETALKGFNILRPVFVPDSNDSVLVISGVRLYAVSGADGSVTDVTRGGVPVTSVSVSSDGRRVAFVADGQAYVSSLGVANSTITISNPNLRRVLSGQIVAKSVTWLSETRLAVAGSAPTGGPALWRVTADGVVAQNLSESLKGVVVDDLVAYPTYPSKTTVDVLVTSNQGVYSLLNSLAPEAGLRAPFFGS